MQYTDIQELKGKIISHIEKYDDFEIIFTLTTGDKYRMYHEQDCCEGVSIEDINGDLNDLIDNPLLVAEECSTSNKNDVLEFNDRAWEEPDSFTYTFYKFATIKGYVTIRWYGESNGYYSESVDLVLIESPED